MGYSDFPGRGYVPNASRCRDPGKGQMEPKSLPSRRMTARFAHATYLDGAWSVTSSTTVSVRRQTREEGSLLLTLLVSWGPMLLLVGVWIYFMRQMQGGGRAVLSALARASAHAGRTTTPSLLPTSRLRRGQGKRSRKSWTS